MINLPAIFNSTNVQPGLVTNKCNFITPSVVNDLNVAPICSKIFTLTILCHLPWLYSPFPVYLTFEHVFTDKYLGTIQADRKDVFTFTLSASKYSFFLQQPFYSRICYGPKVYNSGKVLNQHESLSYTHHKAIQYFCWLLSLTQQTRYLNLSNFILRPSISKDDIQVYNLNFRSSK